MVTEHRKRSKARQMAGLVASAPPEGGLAQLGEHLLCKQGVIGSIPIVSTTLVSGLLVGDLVSLLVDDCV